MMGFGVAVASAGQYNMQTICIAPNRYHTNTSSLSFFTSRMLFLTPNQHCQCTDGNRQRAVKLFVAAVVPLLFRLLIAFINDRSQMVWRGYMYAFLLFVVAFVQSMMLHQYFHRCMVVGMRIRSALVTAVYKKVCLPFIHAHEPF